MKRLRMKSSTDVSELRTNCWTNCWDWWSHPTVLYACALCSINWGLLIQHMLTLLFWSFHFISFKELRTCLKLPLRLCSQSIMSWKMGIMTFLRSGWGTRVTSRNGPIIAGMKFNLCSPEEETSLTLLCSRTQRIIDFRGTLVKSGKQTFSFSKVLSDRSYLDSATCWRSHSPSSPSCHHTWKTQCNGQTCAHAALRSSSENRTTSGWPVDRV